jgi:5'-nucleotidase
MLVMAALLVGVLAPTAAAAPNAKHDPVDIQILSISDWHAQLDPLSIFGVGTFGGAAELSTYFQQERASNPNTLTLTAGDAYGASPPLSSFFDEEPAVRSMRLMGFDADTFGNHNFDGGTADLQSLIDIANDTSGELGTPFQYVSANLKNRDDNLSGVKDFEIFDVGGVKVAVIGLTNPEAPTLVFPGSFGTIEVTDPVAAANKARAAARRAGAKVFVAITHLGVSGFDSAGNAFGPLIDFAQKVGDFDVILGDHTNVQFEGVIKNALVVENRSKGVEYARIELTVDPQNGRVLDRSVTFVDAVSSAVTPDPAIVALLDPLRTQLNALLSNVIGESTVFIPRADACGVGNGRTCESLVGNVTTDAMRTTYGTDFAITNAGGLRADLTCPETNLPTDFCPGYTPPPFPITDGQVLTVLPFGNQVVTVDVGGDELKVMLERGVSAMPGISGRFAQVSGLCFTYDIDTAVGSRVTGAVFQDPDDGTCSGPAVDLTSASTYSIAMNDFMASGGDGYPVVIDRATTRNVMDQDVAAYIGANSPISPAIQGRISCSGSTCPTILP